MESLWSNENVWHQSRPNLFKISTTESVFGSLSISQKNYPRTFIIQEIYSSALQERKRET